MAGSPGSGEDPDFAHCMVVVFKKLACCLEFVGKYSILKTIASV